MQQISLHIAVNSSSACVRYVRAIIYSKRPLVRLRPLPSNNELSAEKAHYRDKVSCSADGDGYSDNRRDWWKVGWF